jgi:beta-phosphoglucomutase family hydrolase
MQRSKTTNFKAVIFDMDGTVIDSTAIDFEAWQTTFKDYQVDLRYDDYLSFLGTKSSVIIKSYLDLDIEETKNLVEKKQALFRKIGDEKGVYPIPFVESFLQNIKNNGFKIALATSSILRKTEFIFSKVQLRHYFDVIITADHILNSKPHPEIFLKAAEELGVQASESLVVEDAENGIIAAKRGQMKCIAIASTQHKDRLQQADLIIDSYEAADISELLNRIEKLEG